MRRLSAPAARSISCNSGWRVTRSPAIQPVPECAPAAIAPTIGISPRHPAVTSMTTGPAALAAVTTALRQLAVANSSNLKCRKCRICKSDTRPLKGTISRARWQSPTARGANSSRECSRAGLLRVGTELLQRCHGSRRRGRYATPAASVGRSSSLASSTDRVADRRPTMLTPLRLSSCN